MSSSTQERLGADVIVINSKTTAFAAKADQPDLIMLFGWMDAQEKHILKYSDQYRLLFPLATILIIKSRQSSFYKFKSAQFNSLRPVQSFIASRYPNLNLQPAKTSPILVHTFSNGGCLGMMRVNQLLQTQTGGGIPARAFIFDSCPGTTSLSIFIRAFSAPIQSQWVKIPASILITFVYMLGGIYNFLRRKQDAITIMSAYLTNQLVASPRLYMFSPTDLLIPSAFVERHAKDAEAKGIDVTMEKFEGTSHVAHTRGEGNSARYWGAISDLWKSSGQSGM